MYKFIVDFIRELYSSPKGHIYLHEPRFLGNEKKYVLDAIDSTFVSSVGPYVDRFEQMMTELTGAKYAVAVVNGTAALHTALKLVGVEQKDEVITQPLSFVATCNAISYEKAIPHFVDVDEDTMSLSPTKLKKHLEQIADIKDGVCFNKETGNRIVACVPMHTFGIPGRIDEVITVCNQYHIAVIEDAAESIGSTYKNRHTGTFGRLGAFSFNGNKTVTSGGGGAIVTDDEELAKKAKHITTTAKVPHKWEYKHDEIGYNYRMPNINAALACAQLEQLGFYVTLKRETADAYAAFFKTMENIAFKKEPSGSHSNYWLNAIQFTTLSQKEEFLLYTNENGVMTRPCWKLMPELSMFSKAPSGDLSIAKKLEQTLVNIPSSVRI